MRRAIVIGSVVALVLGLGAAVLSVRLERAPEDVVIVRVTRPGTRSPRGTRGALLYVAHGGVPGVTRPMFEGPRSPPVTWASSVEGALDGDTLVLEVPLRQASLRDEHLRELRVDGLVFVFDPQGSAQSDEDGRVTLSSHAADGPALDIDSDGLRAVDLTVDSARVPAVRFVVPTLPSVSEEASDAWAVAPTEIEDPFVVLSVPAARYEREDDRMPHLLVRPNAELGIAFTLDPHEHPSDCLRAVVVPRERFDSALSRRRVHGDAIDAPTQVIDRAEWEALLEADATTSGWIGGTPTLSLDPVGRSVWFHAPPGDTGDNVALNDVVLVAGCFDSDAARTRVGLLAVEVRGRR